MLRASSPAASIFGANACASAKTMNMIIVPRNMDAAAKATRETAARDYAT
jgi:hypothetical protein